MQEVKRRKKYRIRPNSPIEIAIVTLLGLMLGAMFAWGMNCIHPF